MDDAIYFAPFVRAQAANLAALFQDGFEQAIALKTMKKLLLIGFSHNF